MVSNSMYKDCFPGAVPDIFILIYCCILNVFLKVAREGTCVTSSLKLFQNSQPQKRYSPLLIISFPKGNVKYVFLRFLIPRVEF